MNRLSPDVVVLCVGVRAVHSILFSFFFYHFILDENLVRVDNICVAIRVRVYCAICVRVFSVSFKVIKNRRIKGNSINSCV